MELPHDEENDEQVMRIPEPLKVGTALLLPGEENHDNKSNGHNPTGPTGSSDDVGLDEDNDALTRVGCIRVERRKFCIVDHVRCDMDKGKECNGPSYCLVEGNVLVEGDDVVQRCATEERDEVTANRQEDEDHVDMEDESGSTSDN